MRHSAAFPTMDSRGQQLVVTERERERDLHEHGRREIQMEVKGW